MEMLIALAIFLGLAIASARWGVDSRELMSSTHQDLASWRE